MSGAEKLTRPVRQLSLQPPAPRRQQIRRQRSAEDENTLQICASPFARGKRGTSAKSSSDRPKVRVAWKENRRRNEEVEQVEVVARQIPGRSRPFTGKSRAFVAIEKPTILYSRQELAERLRRAWKQREQNKANINIFLANSILDERCESEMSNHTVMSIPSSPVRKTADSESETRRVDNFRTIRDDEIGHLKVSEDNAGNCTRKEAEKTVIKKSTEVLSRVDERIVLKENEKEMSNDIQGSSIEIGQAIESRKNEVAEEFKRREIEKTEGGQSNEQMPRNSNDDECYSNTKRKTSPSIDCSNPRVLSATLPSIKIENSSLGVARLSKEDFSLAKQKRANFHSGTNRAFLDPIRSPSKNSISDKTQTLPKSLVDKNSTNRKTTESGETMALEKSVSAKNIAELKFNYVDEKCVGQKEGTDGRSTLTMEKIVRSRTVTESKDSLGGNKILPTQRTDEASKPNSIIKRTSSMSKINDEKNSSSIDKSGISRNTGDERCSSVNERNPAFKKTMENQKMDQKSKRTSSAPPQRHLIAPSSNHRVQVNIVIDSKTITSDEVKVQEGINEDYKDNAVEKVDTDRIKVSSNRSVRSAPLKKRSRSMKRRFWSGNAGKNEEDGKPRIRPVGRTRNSIDSKVFDVVTMVSLVSSADSDSDTENSFRDDKLIDELRSKLPTTSIIKSSINSASSSARKPMKSVSFQKDSFDEDSPKEQQPSPKGAKKTTQPRLAIVNKRGNGASLSREETVSWRTDVVGLALPVLALMHDSEESLDVPLTDREKRCLAVPIGDLHDKKRKLQKTRCTPSRSKIEKQIVSPKTKIQESGKVMPLNTEIPGEQTKTLLDDTSTNVKNEFMSPVKDIIETVQSASIEPRFKTNKEKECWHLYKKMCDKGVCVSFDTVLRGMLTPTEYRLRQKELLENL